MIVKFLFQMELQMWDGLAWNETTMLWSWICLALVLKIYLTFAVGNFLWKLFSCLRIKWLVLINMLVWSNTDTHTHMYPCPHIDICYLNVYHRSTALSSYTVNHFCIEMSNQKIFLWDWESAQIRSLIVIMWLCISLIFFCCIWLLVFISTFDLKTGVCNWLWFGKEVSRPFNSRAHLLQVSNINHLYGHVNAVAVVI